ncbi:hypothetical protein AK812_SmicGene8628 [Symbiodinium microadriaticum]|uniref:Uncharacterized protein n=1 Tax=Symbiodinium microadriaticum TaxID=2951 RepID=A0A1Q9EKG0_SYMMI|nr:hypothetical protein AK812_SmicGene8628 [Symbiodinium microadriaticum]CAE7244995.1 unnamed protein product [Symbiodinium sp. KB8]
MGGKKWADGRALPSSQSSAPWRSSPSAKWNWWSGTWSPRRQLQEMRYDQMEVSQAPDYGGGGSEDAAPTFHQALQKSLTTARKLDGRLRKIASEKDRRHQQWKKYEDQAKKTFLKNRKSYEADIAKLDKEAQETVEAGQLAAAQVKALAIQGTAPAPTAEPMEVEAAWEMLWRNTEAPPSGASFLQEALDASANFGVPRNAPSSGPPCLSAQPPPQQAQPSQLPPNDVSHMGPTEEELRILRKYWDSPYANPVEGLVDCLPNFLPDPKVPMATLEFRQVSGITGECYYGVADTYWTTSRPEKLEQKRDQLKGSATQPFRLPPEHNVSMSDTGDPLQQHANFVDDDKEDLLSVSPGFGQLE